MSTSKLFDDAMAQLESSTDDLLQKTQQVIAERDQLKAQLEAAQREKAQLVSLNMEYAVALERIGVRLAVGGESSVLEAVKLVNEALNLTPPAALAELLKPTITAIQDCLAYPHSLYRVTDLKARVVAELSRLQKLCGGWK